MQQKPILFNFNGMSGIQTIAAKYPAEVIDLSEHRNTDLFCDDKFGSVLNSVIQKIGNDRISFFGSSSYHYITYYFLKNIDAPFNLILFDYHSDAMNAPVLSCGSWLRYAMKSVPLLKKVLIIGIGKDHLEDFSSFPQVSFITSEKLSDLNEVKKKMLEFSDDDLYLSIDKDVLLPEFAETGWDQGTMTLSALEFLIRELIKTNRIKGVDICGDSLSSANVLEVPEEINLHKNEATNLAIMRAIL